MTVERSDNFTDKGIRDRYEHDGREEISKRVVKYVDDSHFVSVSVLSSALPFNFTPQIFFLRLLTLSFSLHSLPLSLFPWVLFCSSVCRVVSIMLSSRKGLQCQITPTI